MNRDFLAYAEFEAFWERFRPETPFGRAEKEALRVHTEGPALEQIWDATEGALGLLADLDAVGLSRVIHHLKRLPRFPESSRALYDEVEIFQIKKFLHNYTRLRDLLGIERCRAFGLPAASGDLALLLDQGRQSAESFYLADAYSPELALVRAELRGLDQALRDTRHARVAAIEARFGLHFGERDFLLVPRNLLGDPAAAADLLHLEPYDGEQYLVRPIQSAAELALRDRQNALLGQERTCEESVLADLSGAIREALPHLLACREAVTGFDLAFARARLAREEGLVRPRLGQGPLRIVQGRFLPCEALCAGMGTPYTPLDAVFDRSVTVIFGSNMGGKTVVLKTLAFLQLCTQTGLFVPAAAFHTRVFRRFHYIGEGCSRKGVQGLSGFGFEIRQLTEAWEDLSEPALLLFDEFARTTGSHEAEALLSALIDALADAHGPVALFSTHFRGVRRIAGAAYRRMHGLDRSQLNLHGADHAALEERICLINRHMDYRLVDDDGTPRASDALTIASLLGMDPRLAEIADNIFRDGT